MLSVQWSMTIFVLTFGGQLVNLDMATWVWNSSPGRPGFDPRQWENQLWTRYYIPALNFDFSKFEPFLKSLTYQNSKLRVSEIVKMAIFEIKTLPKLFSRKTELQIDSWNVNLNFTFWQFLEHSGKATWLIRPENVMRFGPFNNFVG